MPHRMRSPGQPQQPKTPSEVYEETAARSRELPGADSFYTPPPSLDYRKPQPQGPTPAPKTATEAIATGRTAYQGRMARIKESQDRAIRAMEEFQNYERPGLTKTQGIADALEAAFSPETYYKRMDMRELKYQGIMQAMLHQVNMAEMAARVAANLPPTIEEELYMQDRAFQAQMEMEAEKQGFDSADDMFAYHKARRGIEDDLKDRAMEAEIGYYEARAEAALREKADSAAVRARQQLITNLVTRLRDKANVIKELRKQVNDPMAQAMNRRSPSQEYLAMQEKLAAEEESYKKLEETLYKELAAAGVDMSGYPSGLEGGEGGAGAGGVSAGAGQGGPVYGQTPGDLQMPGAVWWGMGPGGAELMGPSAAEIHRQGEADRARKEQAPKWNPMPTAQPGWASRTQGVEYEPRPLVPAPTGREEAPPVPRRYELGDWDSTRSALSRQEAEILLAQAERNGLTQEEVMELFKRAEKLKKEGKPILPKKGTAGAR